MTTADNKRSAAEAALQFIDPGVTLGVGTGSTVNFLIDMLPGIKDRIDRVVSSSKATTQLLQERGFEVSTLNQVGDIDLYIDGADESTKRLHLIKGGGGALTREKIVAAQARQFIVLVDESKMVDQLGTKMPLPVEVVPMAAAPVMNVLKSLGAEPEIRMGMRKDGPVVSDQGMWVVDAAFNGIADPAHVNNVLLNTPGVVDHGLFLDMATSVLVGKADGSVDVLNK